MIKIYFAGKFNLLPNGKNLSQRLIKDFRSILLGDSKKLTFADKDATLQNYPIRFQGPFYCEQASNGNYTSTDCEVVVKEETMAIMDTDIFCCVFDLNFSVGTIVELIDSAHAKKRIVIFYKNESSNYTIKSEYWFAITRAMEICKANGTPIEIFSYNYNVLPVLYNWLTNIVYTKRYVSTRANFLDTYLENCVLVNSYHYAEKTVFHYEDTTKRKLIIEKYSTGLTMVKSDDILEIKGLINVTSNPLYLDKNINNVKVSKAIIEGTDGVGKTSTITRLIEKGIVCFDRSETICEYMLFNIPMEVRISAYKKYLSEIAPYFVIFIINNSREELESRINSRPTISNFDKMAYEYNTLYNDTYMEMLNYHINNPIELVDCTGLTVDEQVDQIISCILRRTTNE